MASFRSADCASRNCLRSRADVSSSSAARLTAPSAVTSALILSIDPCMPASRTLPCSIDRQNSVDVSVCIVQQLLVLLATDAGRLFLELQIGDALAQRIERTLEFESALVAGAQLAVRSSYSLRLAPSAFSR